MYNGMPDYEVDPCITQQESVQQVAKNSHTKAITIHLRIFN